MPPHAGPHLLSRGTIDAHVFSCPASCAEVGIVVTLVVHIEPWTVSDDLQGTRAGLFHPEIKVRFFS